MLILQICIYIFIAIVTFCVISYFDFFDEYKNKYVDYPIVTLLASMFWFPAVPVCLIITFVRWILDWISIFGSLIYERRKLLKRKNRKD